MKQFPKGVSVPGNYKLGVGVTLNQQKVFAQLLTIFPRLPRPLRGLLTD